MQDLHPMLVSSAVRRHYHPALLYQLLDWLSVVVGSVCVSVSACVCFVSALSAVYRWRHCFTSGICLIRHPGSSCFRLIGA